MYHMILLREPYFISLSQTSISVDMNSYFLSKNPTNQSDISHKLGFMFGPSMFLLWFFRFLCKIKLKKKRMPRDAMITTRQSRHPLMAVDAM